MKKNFNRRDFIKTTSAISAGLALGLPTASCTLGGRKTFANKWQGAPNLVNDIGRTSKTIGSVLRESLPAEELSFSQNASELVISGPTFTYCIKKATGVINSFRVVREGQEVITTNNPVDILIDQYQLSSILNSCKLKIIKNGKDKIVIETKGILHDPKQRGPKIDYTVLYTFFNDGVVVLTVKLLPRADLHVENAIVYRLPAQGQFSNYIHKCRDEHGGSAERGKLPESGSAVQLSTLTSCLSVFSPTTALAVFTDNGAIHSSQTNLKTATIEVTSKEDNLAHVLLSQYLVHIAPRDQPYLLKAGEEFNFRVGISVAPNRLPHPRTHDMRMFTWIGDAKFPYPTDNEITQVAQWGYTLFQMHRIGTPGEPRPPAGELQRVISKVHELGMLFIWEVNADLMFNNSPGVQAMKADDKWALWQGFNYGGRYTAKMDPYCDLAATCLASPNGLAEYRLANIGRMFDQFDVDGIFVDDNLAYSNCTLWKEHGHPHQVYDCLIELHEMNWRRRELMRSRCPHMVLISHSTSAFILPIICDFDAHIYGEGYSFESLENYRENYIGSVNSLHAQGMIWPGDDEAARCPTSLAYNYDLLTGGGQYTQIDWRLFPEKFDHASGVSNIELPYSKTYNLAQYFFGLYESKRYLFADSAKLFATTTPQVYASIYHNQVWDDWLVVVANMSSEFQKTSVDFRSPQTLAILPEKDYILFDFHQRTVKNFKGGAINQAFDELSVSGQNLQLYYLRQHQHNAAYHLWGGKRISEIWDAKKQSLTFEVDGPVGLQETIFIVGAQHGIEKIVVEGETATFFIDSAQGIAHGTVTFTAKPLKITVYCSLDRINALSESSVSVGPLALLNTFDKADINKATAVNNSYHWAQVTDQAAFAPRDGAGALVFQHKMWLIGGWNPNDKEHFPLTCSNDVWSSSDGLAWKLVKTNSFLDANFDTAKDWEGRHTAGYVVYKDKMWIVGGDPIQGHYQSDVWNSVDGKTWNHVNREHPVPWGPRALHHTLVFQNKIWVMGGQTVPQFAPGDEMFYRDIWNTDDGIHWKKIVPREPFWSTRGMIGGFAVFKGRMWILGGGTYDTPLVPQREFYNDVWSSADGVNWICHLESAPWSPRQYHEVAVFDNRLWVLEGYYEKGGNRNDVWCSSDGIHWEELPNTPWKPRHAASVFVHDNALWVVAGNNMESDVWKLKR
ncbi:MAG: twin-arginine translocation signal domain-containing protein [Dysgonamonadaceae bacterium]|nr:twin-arginine translocation signal domain-containing protein [Dysgonamonadaceae bacterium]